MSRNLALNLTRNDVSLNDIASRLANKKEARTETKRVRNKVQSAIERAYELWREGVLKPEGEVETITTVERLQDYIKQIRKVGEYTFDVETTGLDVFNDIIVGLCIYVEGLPSAYLPINHTNLANERLKGQLDEAVVRDLMNPIFSNKHIKHVTHNGKFDGEVVLWNWGVKIANFHFDTLIASHLLNENEPHNLKYLYNKYILKGKGSDFDYGDYFDGIPFNYIPIDIATIYGANDGIKTFKLKEFYSKWLDPNHEKEDFRKLAHVFYDIEMPLIPVVMDMEMRGIEIRKDYAKELEIEMQTEIDKLEENMDTILAEIKTDILNHPDLRRFTQGTGKINFNSPQQLAMLFYDVLKLPSPSKKSPRGTGKSEIEVLMSRTKNQTLIKFLEMLLRYKALMKLLSTYVVKMPLAVEPKTNAIHTNFNQTGTVTSRFSSNNPNLQNIPSREKRIRKMFKARDGYKLVGSDYSQIEPRILSFLTYSMFKGTEMWNAYMNGEDLYSMMASKIYNLPQEQCVEAWEDGGKERRDSVKSVLLGIMYERSAGDIAKQFGKPAKWGEWIVNQFIQSFPAIEMVRKYYIHHAEVKGWVSTIDGRKRRLPDMKLSKDNYKYKQAHRQVLNSVIQGTGGDILKKAMVRIGTDERLKELDAHLLLTIHDELVMEVPEEHVAEAGKLMADIMKQVGSETLGGLFMSCDVEVTSVWYGENEGEKYGF